MAANRLQEGSADSALAHAWDMNDLFRAALVEAFGTFLLVLAGTAVATATALHGATAGPASDSLSIALAFGLMLIPVVVSLGEVSGAHVNPAVTLGLASVGHFPWVGVPAYWAAQLFGATVASLTVWAAYGEAAYQKAALGAPAPAHGAETLQVLLCEALIAFILVFTVIAVKIDRRVPAGVAPFVIGLALFVGVLLAGPVSGGAGNPAGALGPMLMTHLGPAWSLYVLGPLLGGVLGAKTYLAVTYVPMPKV